MIRIVEVGPRDGLQNESGFVPTPAKIAFVNALSRSGVYEIEVSSFVHPTWVPQLADADQLFAGIERHANVIYSALVPNEQGMRRALAAKPDKVAVFTSPSETFNRRNINTSLDGSFARFAPVMRMAAEHGLPVRGYVSVAFRCPFEGRVPPQEVANVVERLFGIGVQSVSLGDTVGRATPDDIAAVLRALSPRIELRDVALHLHDTHGRAIANALAGWEHGITQFDTSVSGLGGCPYAPGSPGNLSTQLLVEALKRAGAPVAVDTAALNDAWQSLQSARSAS